MIIPHFETPDDNDYSEDYEQYKRKLTMSDEIYTDSTPMPFGKYDGKKLANVPASYLLWLRSNGCSDKKTEGIHRGKLR